MAPRKKTSTSKGKRKRTGAGKTGRAVFRLGRLRKGAFLKLFLLGFCVVFAGLIWLCWDLPDTAQVKPTKTAASITVLANDGTLVARYGGLQGDLVDIAKLPPHVPRAVVAIEDRRFYSHFGIDLRGLARAMWANVRAGAWVQGGSTITQQLAKNLFLTPDKTLRRKAQEALLALWIDWRFSKDDILEAYLNRVYFGAGAYGIDAAAQTYFGKPASKMSIWEAAMMAGVLKAPSRYAPSASPEKAIKRAKVVIGAMRDAGFIDEKKAAEILKTAKVRLSSAQSGDLNRYFSDWVVDQLDGFIVPGDRDIVVKTTFDPAFQILAEERLKAFLASLPKDEIAPQAAVVTLAKNGAVLAMIGGTDYTKSQFNRAASAQRQPGSSFKPFVYLGALEAGFYADDKIEDAPVAFGKYKPENYDGRYYGTVSLTDALALSLNAATMRLLDTVGVQKLVSVTQRLGFTKDFRAELATGLGADESTLLEMTNAYAVIANGGHTVWPFAVLSIEDTDGKVLYKYTNPGYTRVFATKDVRDLDSMLVQVVARGTGQAAQLSRGHVAGKTGTSQNYRDAWFIGYTDNLVTGVWMGHDDNTPMNKVTGGKYPARLWRDYMNGAIGMALPSYARGFSSTGGLGGFGDLLDRWSSGNFSGGTFTGSNSAPRYND